MNVARLIRLNKTPIWDIKIDVLKNCLFLSNINTNKSILAFDCSDCIKTDKYTHNFYGIYSDMNDLIWENLKTKLIDNPKETVNNIIYVYSNKKFDSGDILNKSFFIASPDIKFDFKYEQNLNRQFVSNDFINYFEYDLDNYNVLQYSLIFSKDDVDVLSPTRQNSDKIQYYVNKVVPGLWLIKNASTIILKSKVKNTIKFQVAISTSDNKIISYTDIVLIDGNEKLPNAQGFYSLSTSVKRSILMSSNYTRLYFSGCIAKGYMNFGLPPTEILIW